MGEFGTLYRYELKKLTGRKLFWVTAILCVAAIVLSVFSGVLGTYYVDGKPIESNYEAFRKDQAYRKALSGSPIDDALLQKTVAAYRQVPLGQDRYSLTREYETYARPYSAVFNLIRSWTGMDLPAVQTWEADGTALYQARTEQLESIWQSIPLTETEKEFWRTQESRQETPFLYLYHEGYEILLNCFLTVGLLMLLFTAVCLSNLFADEHIRRTDQLVLSSTGGRERVYWAKILAGVTVSLGGAAVMSLTVAGLSMGLYGAEGFSLAFQVSYATYSYPISIGQACLIAYGMLLVTSVLAGVFVMVISEVLRSAVTALSISTALIILGNVVMIPPQYRVLAQIWDWSPVAYLSTWNVFDPRTLTLFGICVTSWQIVPVIYLLLSLGLALGGKIFYRSYQVSGR